MKECKIITINDGIGKVLKNGDHIYVEEKEEMENCINEFLKKGWEVKSISPVYNPGMQGDTGSWNFYIGGYTVYMERNGMCNLT